MQIIAVDGSYVKSSTATQLRVAPAQRYTVLITALNTPNTNYAFLASLDINRDFANHTVPAVYPHNITGYIIYNEQSQYPQNLVVNAWTPADDTQLQDYAARATLPTPTKNIVLNFTFGLDSIGVPR